MEEREDSNRMNEGWYFVCAYPGCSERATCGSAKHPYCPEHWESEWDGNYDLYAIWFDCGGHAAGMSQAKFKKLIGYKSKGKV